jgi:hypothetical protein
MSLFFGHLNYILVENRFRLRSKESIGKLSSTTLALYVTVLISLFCLWQANNYLMKRGVTFDGSQTRLATEFSTNCKLEFRKSPCIFNSGGKKGSVLLFGDSHAAMFGKTFLKIAEGQDRVLYVWSRPACQFFYTEDTALYKSHLKYCVQNNLLIKNWIEIHQPNEIYLSNVDALVNLLYLNINQDKFMNLQLKSFASIKSLKTRKVFILPTPKLPEYSLTSYLRHKGSFNLPWNQILDEKKWIKAAKIFDLRYIKPSETICPNLRCKKMIQGVQIFSDFDHLTLNGANLLSEKINSSLVPHE